MCGICGFYGLDDKELLKRMSKSIIHRGPDDSGYYYDKGIGLASRRLSIIDLPSGKQPMHNEDRTIWIVFNGEIYNFKDLRDDLEKKSHRFYTNSDTEAIIHCYEEYGFGCLDRLKGMFAFAIWDSREKMLFIARDRFGKKPLYFYADEDSFLFASEIKSLLQDSEIPRRLNRQALHDYLTFRYVPEPSTLLDGIKKLPAGSYLVVKGGKLKIKKYWSLEFGAENEKNEDYYIKNFTSLFEDAVERRLISDVPLGLYLSGGIDSSSILSIMQKHSSQPVKTFTIGYNLENFNDETWQAGKVAEFYGSEHREFIVDDNPLEILPNVVWHMDEPVADPTSLPIFLLSKLTKKHVTVVLEGEGSDEMLAGYEHYKLLCLANNYLRLIPKLARSKLIPLLMERMPLRFFDRFFAYSSSLGEKGMERFLNLIADYSSNPADYLKLNGIFLEDEKNILYSANFKKNNFQNSTAIIGKYFSAEKNKDFSLYLKELLQCDANTFLGHLLLKTDKMTMAHGIEARVPFIDSDLAEFAARMPPHMKLNGMVDKYVLRKSMKDKVPDFITSRKKQRFFVPIHIWFEGVLRDGFEQLFKKPAVAREGLFDHSQIRKILENYGKSRLYYSRQLWTLLNFELWYKIFIENDEFKNPKLNIRYYL